MLSEQSHPEALDKENLTTSARTVQNKPSSSRTMRSKAALLLNLLDSSSDEEATDNNKKSGIYGNIIKDTLKEKSVIKQQVFNYEAKSPESNNAVTLNIDENDHSSVNQGSLDSDSSASSDNLKIKKSRLTRKESSSSLSPPPSPKIKQKPKRKSTNLIDRQLKDLTKFTTKTSANFDSSNDEGEPELVLKYNDMITIRVSTKSGMQRFEMNRNNKFHEIFEKIAALEDNRIENLILKIRKRDLKINYHDTPASLEHSSVDVIDCEYIKGKKQERIQIIENEDEDDENKLFNTVRIILQTSVGRKSRVKFLIAKDEPLRNVIAKYCEKCELENSEQYMLEFDGDVVSATETAEDLDLDGDEIFDVKKSSKPTMQLVAENKKNYEFDDDILIC